MKKLVSILLALALLAALSVTAFADALPASEPDETNMFGVDRNINMATLDEYLGRDDVAYRDVRMLFDPADYAAIGGNADLASTVEGAYDGDTLFTLTWNEDGSIASATANYEESMLVLEDLFPKDKAIFLMCGGGGYAGMTKSLLIFLGWDPELLYNVGGNWAYEGDHGVELIQYSEDADGNDYFCTWRADYALIDFSRLHPVA